jgi:hypothetical protein
MFIEAAQQFNASAELAGPDTSGVQVVWVSIYKHV